MRAHRLLPLVLAVIAATSCSNDDSSPKSSATVRATSPGDTAAATVEIKKTWSDFFGPKLTTTQKADLLEDGASMGASLAQAAKNPAAKVTTASVSSVTFSSPTKAAVTYDLTVAGNKALSGANGEAVLQGGHWKVSKFTYCQLQKAGSPSGSFPGC